MAVAVLSCSACLLPKIRLRLFTNNSPPFTIPALRRNEVWIELTEAQVDDLMQSFSDVSVKK